MATIQGIGTVEKNLTMGNKGTNDNQVINHKHTFENILKSALNQVSQIEKESDKKTDLLVQGKMDDLHDVMIIAQKANITIETAVQVQQKAIDTYNEMMRMQI